MVITRFAPSPTGDLHIGSARTALFCWLWAKNQQGKCILRIEDTDRERSTEAAIQVIIEGLAWLGLDFDQGPIYQTQRFPRYAEVAEQLLNAGKAYKCYCSKARLEALREQQIAAKEKPRYDGHCLQHPSSITDKQAPYVIRFNSPKTGVIAFDDVIKGRIEFQNAELDDLIIVRSDGTPTYNFTVVVDDWEMGITHVLRGDDHINNTPRQLHILQALGAKLPYYAHMPMLLGKDGKKLSKRDGAASVLDYQLQGILPEALINYIARLGWSHGDTEIFSVDELIKFFAIKNINSAPAAMNPEKLLWLNQHYLKTQPEQAIAPALAWQLKQLNIDPNFSQGPDLAGVVVAQRERCKTLKEMAEKSAFFFQDLGPLAQPLLAKHFLPAVVEVLKIIITSLAALDSAEWQAPLIHETIAKLVEKAGLKLGEVAQPIRIAVSGGTVSPPIDLTLALLGQAKTIERLEAALVQAAAEKKG